MSSSDLRPNSEIARSNRSPKEYTWFERSVSPRNDFPQPRRPSRMTPHGDLVNSVCATAPQAEAPFDLPIRAENHHLGTPVKVAQDSLAAAGRDAVVRRDARCGCPTICGGPLYTRDDSELLRSARWHVSHRWIARRAIRGDGVEPLAWRGDFRSSDGCRARWLREGNTSFAAKATFSGTLDPSKARIFRIPPGQKATGISFRVSAGR
jgi:hypothetical protein